jgi:hypothetical protein
MARLEKEEEREREGGRGGGRFDSQVGLKAANWRESGGDVSPTELALTLLQKRT